jgi:IMP dehydrogenase
MVKFRKQTGLSADDVLLVPQYSTINSRSDVDLSTKLGNIDLRLPILASNMDTVCEADMAIAMGKAGGAGILHRFSNPKQIGRWVDNCRAAEVPTIISIGSDCRDLGGLQYYIDVDTDVSAICVDVAHGDHKKIIEIIKQLKEWNCKNIIAGNVATGNGALRLVEAGANIIKVGIGPGSVCSTRVVTGHGYPQLSAIIEVREALGSIPHIIADGGVRYPGDIVKYIAAGADAVMLGSLLAGTDEAPGERMVEHGQVFKTYRGMASFAAQKDKKENKVPRVEGVSARVPYRGPVRDTLDNLEAGIRSGLSYSGAANLEELRNRAEFVVVTGNTLRESHPHHPYKL